MVIGFPKDLILKFLQRLKTHYEGKLGLGVYTHSKEKSIHDDGPVRFFRLFSLVLPQTTTSAPPHLVPVVSYRIEFVPTPRTQSLPVLNQNLKVGIEWVPLKDGYIHIL